MTEAKAAPLAPEDVGKDADWGTFRDCLKLSCRPARFGGETSTVFSGCYDEEKFDEEFKTCALEMLLDEEKRDPYRKYIWDIFMPKEQKTACKTNVIPGD